MNSGIRFLTPEAIAEGKNPYTSTDLTDFSVHAPEYRNLKYVGMEDLPLAIDQVTILAGEHASYGIIEHNMGYRPIIKMWFEDLNGLLVPIPGKSYDTPESCAIPITFHPVSGLPLDLTKEIGFFIGSNIKIPSNYLYPATTVYNIFYQIYVEKDNGDL